MTVKEQIHNLVKQYYEEYHKGKKFEPGSDNVKYGGRVYDSDEIVNLVDAALDFWLTSGPWTERFERNFADFLGIRYCSLTNSGSSANLLAFYALTSPLLKEGRIEKGDEVITVACAFPTTVTPIIQYGAVPVFVDIEVPSYNINVDQLETALSDKTKAVMIAHTLGNPFDVHKVKEFCDKHRLWLIEDNCDALGSKYLYKGEWKYTGTIGDIGTSSFYPPHHMTMGEGGAVYTNNPLLNRIINSYRDWGRDCWCPSGRDNTCNSRFLKQYGELPLGYDHKYVYSHFGFNLKATDMQAAVGCAQLEKLPGFIDARRKNWDMLRARLNNLENVFILPEPQKGTEPSWFGFILTVKDSAKFTRNELVQYLEDNKIQTRTLFAGNLLKHPVFDEMRKSGNGFRVVKDLSVTDMVMNNTFWIGVYPGMSDRMLNYMIDKIRKFVANKNKSRG